MGKVKNVNELSHRHTQNNNNNNNDFWAVPCEKLLLLVV